MKSGKGEGRFFVIVGFRPPKFVYIADGKRFTLERPKRKSIAHIKPFPFVSEKVEEGCIRGSLENTTLREEVGRLSKMACGGCKG